MNNQDWFPLGLTGLISLQSKGFSRVFSNPTVQKHKFFCAQPSLWSNSHIPYMTTGKTIALIRRTFVGKVMSLLFNILSGHYHFMANRWETMETVTDFIFSGSKITTDGDCSHEIKRCLLLGRKAMTNLYSILPIQYYKVISHQRK